MLSRTWAIGERPHGGYLLALLGRAAVEGVRAVRGDDDHPHPLTTSAVFLRSPSFGPATVDVEVLRTGRTASHAQATLIQEGRPCVRVLLVVGRLGPPAPPLHDAEPVPALPSWDECAPRPRPVLPDGSLLRIGLADVVDMRFDPASLGEGTGREPRSPVELRAWLTFSDGRPPDPLALLFTLDALPPVTFALGRPGWAPTLELTAYTRALPAPGPLRVRQRGRLVQPDTLDEVCDVWDSEGRLVGQATQLALVPRPF